MCTLKLTNFLFIHLRRGPTSATLSKMTRSFTSPLSPLVRCSLSVHEYCAPIHKLESCESYVYRIGENNDLRLRGIPSMIPATLEPS